MPANFPVSDGDFIEVRLMGTIHAQQFITTFRYEVEKSTPAGLYDFDAINSTWQSDIWTPLRVIMSNEVLNCRIQVQKIAPSRYIYAEYLASPAAGAVTTGCLTSGVAFDFRRRTPLAGKSFRGRFYLPGVPIASENDSAVTSVVLASADVSTICENMTTQLNPGLGVLLTPSLIVPSGATYANRGDIVQLSLDPVLRYQRRRELRVGS